MKFSVGDLVTLKDTIIRDLRVMAIGIVVDFWPVEHSKHGYVYNVVSAQFGRTRRDLPEDDLELLSKIDEKKVDDSN
jgi:hypothetical protein